MPALSKPLAAWFGWSQIQGDGVCVAPGTGGGVSVGMGVSVGGGGGSVGVGGSEVGVGGGVLVGWGPGYGVLVTTVGEGGSGVAGTAVADIGVAVAPGGGGGGLVLVGTAVAVWVARTGVSGGMVAATGRFVARDGSTHSAPVNESQPVRPSGSKIFTHSPVRSLASTVTTSPVCKVAMVA